MQSTLDIVKRFECGIFTIERFEVSHDDKGCPRLRTLEFIVHLEGDYRTTGSSARPR